MKTKEVNSLLLAAGAMLLIALGLVLSGKLSLDLVKSRFAGNGTEYGTYKDAVLSLLD